MRSDMTKKKTTPVFYDSDSDRRHFVPTHVGRLVGGVPIEIGKEFIEERKISSVKRFQFQLISVENDR